ncbi:MAG TPA: hypothetical protein VLU95_03245 [Candidatus Acidoferrum sp.]|nr:hypothetical protein [Candidatus Acidoferrum sp.]
MVHNALTIAIFVMGLLIIGSITMQGAYAAPTVSVSPTSGPPGTTVRVYGSGFTSNGQIHSALWNGTSAYNFDADASGNLNTTVTVPNVEAGLYGFTITDVTTQSTTQTQFTVTQSSTSPTPTSTSSTSTSPSPTPRVPEFGSIVVVLTILIALSITATLTVRKSKTRKSHNSL